MNPLGKLLSADDIRLDVDAGNAAQLLEQVAALLAARNGLSAAAIFAALTSRERLGSTGVGHGIAIPHARMSECAAPAAVVVRAKVPIPFDAPDRKPVSIFLGLIIPTRGSDKHLQLLSTAASMFSDRSFRHRLHGSEHPSAFHQLVADWSDPSPSVAE